MHLDFKENDLSTYNMADCPWIRIELNGKIDIGNKLGDKEKIGLEKHAIIRFINQYIQECNHELSDSDKKEILSNLNINKTE